VPERVPPPTPPPAELVFAQIDAAIAVGQVDRARQLVAWALQVHGQSPTLASFISRLNDVVPTLPISLPPVGLPPPPPPVPPAPAQVTPAPAVPPARPAVSLPIEAWVAQAHAHVRAANYEQALTLLRQARAAAPGEEALDKLLQNTEKAAARHHAAIEREHAIGRTVRAIEAEIAAGELEDARAALRAAQAEHGRHPGLEQLQASLQQRLDDQRRVEAGVARNRAKELLAAEDFYGALSQAEQALALEPDHGAARTLQAQAQARIAELEKRKQRQESVAAAGRDVERLIAAREPQQASARLAQAIQRLGRDASFDALAQRIDDVKTDLQYQVKHEWAERRAHEAESLIQEAVRLSLANDFGRAVERLEAAHKLEPDHPELEAKLTTARALMHKQRAEQEKLAEIQRLGDEAQRQLEEMELDRAESLMQRLAQRHGEVERLAPLRARLQQLRAAEQSARILVRPEDLPTLDRATEHAIAERQRLVIGRYGFGEGLAYPFRGQGPWLLAASTLLLLGLDLAALSVPQLGALRTFAPLGLFALATPLVGATVRGRDDLALADLKLAGQLPGAFLAFLLPLLCLAPIFFLVATRDQHGLFGADAGPLGYLAVALACWPILPLLLPMLGAGAAFGNGHLLRLGRHLRALAGDGGHAWWVAFCGLLLAFASLLLRLVVAPRFPALGLPLAALLAAYALLLLPHLIGLNIRRRRLELARLYAR
jgi:hypothetical protein